MHNIDIFIQKYLKNTSYIIIDLPIDASFRQYARITSGNKTYILMKAPPEHYQLMPFINIANFLNSHNLSAPEIYAIDHEQGWMILEDFGSNNIKDYILTNPKKSLEIYQKIIDVLIELQNIFTPSSINSLTNDSLLNQLEIFLDWYLPLVGKNISLTERQQFLCLWQDILNDLPQVKSCVVLWDYHIENLMLLDRPNLRSIGLLDFQDAVIGSPLYDLVSVLEDARIDVSKVLANQLFDYYLSKSNINRNDAIEHYHILGAQRNLRIIGVFARKYLRDKNDSYLKYLDRVKNYLSHDLTHPKLNLVKLWLDKII